ncbi:MAG: histidine phosphatase family protein [Acidimicrobiia bacterium]
MKRIILLRHAKAGPAGPGGSDRDRPLTSEGREAAVAIGRLLAGAAEIPDLAISSSALRALTTLELAAEAGGWACPVEASDDLYEDGPAEVLEIIRSQDEATQRLLLVGHDPAWSRFASTLIGGGALRIRAGTATAIDCDVDSWNEVGEGCGRLQWMVPSAFG